MSNCQNWIFSTSNSDSSWKAVYIDSWACLESKQLLKININSGKNPGKFREISGKMPGNFREMSGKFPGNVWKTSGKLSGKFAGNFREISGKCPGNFRETSGGPSRSALFTCERLLTGCGSPGQAIDLRFQVGGPDPVSRLRPINPF